MKKNVNTKNYWDNRFGSGDWQRKGGFSQTTLFAKSQMKIYKDKISKFDSICDFGCGAGDGFVVYNEAWPHIKLYGVDFSESAIDLCRTRYGKIADFACGGVEAVPIVDCVICSNVLEHVDDDFQIVDCILKKCKRLFIIVPYEEQVLSSEHLRRYTGARFDNYNVLSKTVFESEGWTEMGLVSNLIIIVCNLKNLIMRKELRRRRLQIMFEIEGNL